MESLVPPPQDASEIGRILEGGRTKDTSYIINYKSTELKGAWYY